MKLVIYFCMVLLWWPVLVLAEANAQYPGTEPNGELRISVNNKPVLGERDMEKLERAGLITTQEQAGALYEANVIPIEMGRSLQLKVEMIEANGTVTDVTHSPTIFYEVIGERGDLITNTFGLITATVSRETIFLPGKVFIIYGTPEKSGYNKIFFDIKPSEK